MKTKKELRRKLRLYEKAWFLLSQADPELYRKLTEEVCGVIE